MKRCNENLISTLMEESTISIRDALWKDIHLSPSLYRVYHCSCMQKLGRIKQLGPVFHIYPSAVHTRLDHSLGVYHLSYCIVLSLLKRKTSTLLSEEGIKSFLCAALLHDIGHFPYAHSLKELPLSSHESLATKNILGDKILFSAISDCGVQPSVVADIIDKTRINPDKEIQFYRLLLSGTLDPDKLDYLNRDAFFCGVPYGDQDASYITDHLAMAEDKPVLEISSISSIEHLLFSKYLMFRNVYWHRYTRSATAMIKKALLMALKDRVFPPEELYDLDDDQFFCLGRKFDHPGLRLLDEVRDNRLLACSFEENFNLNREMDTKCLDLTLRTEYETGLYHELKKKYPLLQAEEIIVDIPEPVSFESDMGILLDNGTVSSFATEDQLFQPDISQVFANCLRKTRVYTPSYIDRNILNNLLK